MLRLNSLHETDFQKSDGDANPKSNRPMHEQAFGNFPICVNCGRDLRTRQAEPANDNKA